MSASAAQPRRRSCRGTRRDRSHRRPLASLGCRRPQQFSEALVRTTKYDTRSLCHLYTIPSTRTTGQSIMRIPIPSTYHTKHWTRLFEHSLGAIIVENGVLEPQNGIPCGCPWMAGPRLGTLLTSGMRFRAAPFLPAALSKQLPKALDKASPMSLMHPCVAWAHCASDKAVRV